MDNQRTSLEIIAPSIQEAIAKGLEELGVPEEAVRVEILDEGSRGFLGLGTRQARIRLSLENRQKSKQAVEPISTKEVELPEKEDTTSQTITKDEQQEPSPETSDLTLEITRLTVQELLEKMKVKAEVTAEFNSSEDESAKQSIQVNIHGNDLSILIGRQAETLNALQYITGLIVCKEMGKSVHISIDVEGYRHRREQQIRQIAQRMADQAVKTGRRQVLEPMPANERRLIHLELRNHPQVSTESIGEEPRRKVTIIPK
ncbi:MAG: Jag N-terminal domain-containing protein [Anaerolineales bacterium]|nr:Jag N-terminal domain-containing protein [Anaerolineales bacterium]